MRLGPWVMIAFGGCATAHDAPADAEVVEVGRDADLDATLSSMPDTGSTLWVEDTLGWRVPFDCIGDECEHFRDAPLDHPVRCEDASFGGPYERFVAINISGRLSYLLATCTSERGWMAWWEVARPIVCSNDADCARLQHVDGPPSCVEGLCQRPELPFARMDVLVLCSRNVPRPLVPLDYPLPPALEEAWRRAELACPRGGDTCTVPPECLP
jgi:hypothetical protein